MRKFPVLALLLFFSINSSGQFYEYGQDDGRIKWSFFNSKHYRLIYPQGLDSIAFTIADRLEYYYPFQAKELQSEHRIVPVILHNGSSFSNGVVSWAPRRLEVFTNPDPNGYPQDWLTQLVIHEGRHVFQVDKMNQGFTHVLYVLLGEQVVGAVTGYLPKWYIEGDAVDAETRFSYSGRGRLPSFEMGNRAILLDRNKPYSYSKAILGSYKDYVPDHYQTGYLLVDYARREWGEQFWNDMARTAARKPYSVVPAHIAFKEYGVKSKNQLYQQAMEAYRAKWQEQDSLLDVDPPDIWNHARKKSYTHYQFPHFIDEEQIICLKTGMDQIPQFVSIDQQGNEKVVYVPGYLNSGRFSAAAGKIAWDEFIPDLRWSNLNYSSIKWYDPQRRDLRVFGKKTRYYSPALSSSGYKIAAVEQSADYSFSLVLIDAKTDSITRIPSPGRRFIQQPAWMDQDSAVVVCLVDDEKDYLYSYSPGSGSWKELYCNGHEDISWPVVQGKEIFFSATNSGIDDIYCLDLETQMVTRRTVSRFGATQPSLSYSGEELLYADYTARGYEPVLAPVDKWTESLEDVEKPELAQSREPNKEEEAIIEGVKNVPAGNYEPGAYNKAGGLIHIHSWLPLYFDYLNPSLPSSLEAIPVNPGLTLVSQNLLSTAVSSFGYEYKGGYHYLHSGIVLKGRYPVVEIGLHYGGEPYVVSVDNTVLPVLSPNNLALKVNSYLPLRFNTGRMVTYLQPGISWNYEFFYFYFQNPDGYRRGMNYINYSVYFVRYLRKGKRDIVPQGGFAITGRLLTTPFEDQQYGTNFGINAAVYFPGFTAHHAFKATIAGQHQQLEKYFYSNIISLPRGIDRIYARDMFKVGLDYILPLGYPDLSLGFLGYIPRIRGAVWMDCLYAEDVYLSDFSDEHLEYAGYITTGLDLVFDVHPLRFSYPVSVGGRLSYLMPISSFRPELLLSIDLP